MELRSSRYLLPAFAGQCRSETSLRLPNELQGKLKLAVGSGGTVDGIEVTNLADIDGADREPAGRIILWIRIHEWGGHGKKRVIQNIKGFESELHVYALRNGRRLHGTEVETGESGTAQNAAAGAAKYL